MAGLRAICYWCGKILDKASVKRCGRCKVSCYCSSECQAEDWKTGKFLPHKTTCLKGGESLQEDTSELIDKNMDMQECIKKFIARDPKTPGVIGVMKHLFMQHSDPKLSFTLPGAMPERQQGPPKPPPLGLKMMELGAGLNPQNAPASWLLQPALLNLLIHDRLLDVSQVYLKYKEMKNQLDASDMSEQDKAKKLEPLRAASNKDLTLSMYGALVMGMLLKIAIAFTYPHGGQQIPPAMRKLGEFCMRRVVWLLGDDETCQAIGWPAMHCFRDLVQLPPAMRMPFIELGGLEVVIKLFKNARIRLLCINVLANLNADMWLKLGTPALLSCLLEDMLVPGLVTLHLDDDFCYMYSDVTPRKLGLQHAGGGIGRSKQDCKGSMACGYGFGPFGAAMVKKIVEADMKLLSTGVTATPLREAIKSLTKEGDSKSIAGLFYLREKLGLGEEGQEDKKSAEVQFAAADMMEAMADWTKMAYSEKKPYYYKAHSPEERVFLSKAGVYSP